MTTKSDSKTDKPEAKDAPAPTAAPSPSPPVTSPPVTSAAPAPPIPAAPPVAAPPPPQPTGPGGEVLLAGQIKLSTGTIAAVRVAIQFPGLTLSEQRELETTTLPLAKLEMINERRVRAAPPARPVAPATPPAPTPRPAPRAPAPASADTRGSYPGSPFPRPARGA